MDRRQTKTKAAIYTAFSRLLKAKRYEQISVTDILAEADICRSTFYAHFETKDALLDTMCHDIFDHIFEGGLCEYSPAADDLQTKLAHILWHLQANAAIVSPLLLSDSADLFLKAMHVHLTTLFTQHIADFPGDVPTDFFIHHLTGSFCHTILWWVKRGMSPSAEETAVYFLRVTETHP